MVPCTMLQTACGAHGTLLYATDNLSSTQYPALCYRQLLGHMVPCSMLQTASGAHGKLLYATDSFWCTWYPVLGYWQLLGHTVPCIMLQTASGHTGLCSMLQTAFGAHGTMHYATSLKVEGSINNEATKFFNRPNPSSYTVALRSTQPLTEISTMDLSNGKGYLVHKVNNITATCEPTV
jgi:hypothetical protein